MTKPWRSSCCRSAPSTGRWCGISPGAGTVARGWPICHGLCRSIPTPRPGGAPFSARKQPWRRAGARSPGGEADLERERDDAPGLFVELLEQPAEARDLIVRDSPRFQTWGIFELLVERSLEATLQDSTVGEHLGLLALQLSDPSPRWETLLPR